MAGSPCPRRARPRCSPASRAGARGGRGGRGGRWAVGYGAGSMDLDMPNVIRVFVGEGSAGLDRPDTVTETVYQVETTVDDMSPQLWEPLMDRLFEAGALDVYLTAVLMKKSRPGVVLTAFCEPAEVGSLARALFEESTTIGLRWMPWPRQSVSR